MNQTCCINGQRTEHVKTGHVKTDRFRGEFRGHFRGHPRGTFRGDFRGESLKGQSREVNVCGHSRGHPRGRSRGGFRGPTRGVKFRGSRALCLSESIPLQTKEHLRTDWSSDLLSSTAALMCNEMRLDSRGACL